MTVTARGQVFTGARAKIFVSGQQIGYSIGLDGEETIVYEPIRTVGRLSIVEFAPVAYDVRMSMRRIRLVGPATGNEGSLRGNIRAFPKRGTTDEEFLNNILDLPDVQISVQDIRTQTVVALMESAVIASRSFGVDAGALVMENVVIFGTRMLDEEETE